MVENYVHTPLMGNHDIRFSHTLLQRETWVLFSFSPVWRVFYRRPSSPRFVSMTPTTSLILCYPTPGKVPFLQSSFQMPASQRRLSRPLNVMEGAIGSERTFTALLAFRSLKPSFPIWIDALCLYFDRYQTEYLRNLRFGPLFSEGFHFASRINSSAFASPYGVSYIVHLAPQSYILG